MRLLQATTLDDISLTKQLYDEKIPRYAILSHTWGNEEDEVTFKDIESGSYRDKPGYEKIRFCMQQAHRDGYSYCWIDTCCIDKSGTSELSETLISMFRWYAGAQKCYVYLSDVESDQDWIDPFKQSRWFTRGWTLQELIAPKVVEFYTKDGSMIASKASHTALISEITHLPTRALQDFKFHHFTIDERLQWQNGRSTTRDEDMIYSLLGLLNVAMPVLYEEGREQARKRLNAVVRGESMANGDYSLGFTLRTVAKSDCFVGREQELANMREYLTSSTGRRCVVLSGLGGIGKTQLALAYAERHRNDYTAIFWIDAKDKDSVKSSYQEAARRINKRYPNAMTQHEDDPVSAVMDWLGQSGNTGWLLVCDNHDTPLHTNDSTSFALDQYLPEEYHGSVIVTTRSSNIKLEGSTCLAVPILRSDTHSLTIVKETSQRPDVLEDPHVYELAARLDGLPLALASAGAYLHNSSMACETYMKLLDNSWADLQKHTPSLDFYDRTLYSTWQTSYDSILEEDPNAAMLLKFWAYLDNSDVWFELLQAGADSAPWLQEITQTELIFDKTMRSLCDRGFVQPIIGKSVTENCGYSVHSCVHAWIREVVNPFFNDELALLAMECIGSRMSCEPVVRQRLLLHVNTCVTYHRNLTIRPEVSMACYMLAHLCNYAGKFREAFILFEYVYTLWRDNIGPTDEVTLGAMSMLGSVKMVLLELDDAEDLLKQALALCAASDGTDLQDLAVCQALDDSNTRALVLYRGVTNMDLLVELKYNLANVYKLQGDNESEERVLREALQESMVNFGLVHRWTLLVLNRLAVLCICSGRYEEATNLSQKAKLGCVELHETSNFCYMMTTYNLAMIHSHKSRYQEASTMLEECILLSRQTFGSDYPFTVRLIAELSTCLIKAQRYDSAKPLLEEVIESRKQLPPAMQEIFWEAVYHLAILHDCQNELDKAEELYHQVLQCDVARMRLHALYRIGRLYSNQQRYHEAEESWQLWQDVYDHKDDHSSVTLSLWLAKDYSEQRRWEEAKRQYRKCLDGIQKLQDVQERSSVAAAELGSILVMQDRPADAEPFILQAYLGFFEIFGSNNLATIAMRLLLCRIYADLGRLDEAEIWIDQVTESMTASNDFPAKDTVIVLILHGMIYHQVKKSLAAITSLRRAIQTCREHRDIDEGWLTAHTALALIYVDKEQYADAVSVHEEIPEIRQRCPQARTLLLYYLHARAYLALNRTSDAEACLRCARESFRDNDLMTDRCLIYYMAGELCQRQGQLDEALGWYLRSVETDIPAAIVLHCEVALAALYKQMKRWEESKAMYRTALNHYESDCGVDCFLVFATMNDLALLLAETGNDQEAEVLYNKALSGLRTFEQDTTLCMLGVAINLAFLKVRQSRYMEAKILVDHIMQYSTQAPFPDYQQVALLELRQALKQQTRPAVFNVYGYELIRLVAPPPNASTWNACTLPLPWWRRREN